MMAACFQKKKIKMVLEDVEKYEIYSFVFKNSLDFWTVKRHQKQNTAIQL